MYHIVLGRLVLKQYKHHLHTTCSLPILPLSLPHTRRSIERNLRKWNRTIPRNVLEKETCDWTRIGWLALWRKRKSGREEMKMTVLASDARVCWGPEHTT